MKRFLFACLAIGCVLSTPSFASGSSGPPSEIADSVRDNPVCRAVNYFLVGAAATHLGRGAQSAVVAGAALAGIGLSSDAIQATCEHELAEFIHYYEENPIVYDDWVRYNCQGNPFNCPGNLSVNPSTCNTFIVCTPYLMPSNAVGVSIANIMTSMQLIDLAYSTGSWNSGPISPPGSWMEP